MNDDDSYAKQNPGVMKKVPIPSGELDRKKQGNDFSKNSRKSSHHSHHNSEHYKSRDGERSTERRYKSVSAAESRKSKSSKNSSSSSHRSASSSRGHVQFPDDKSFHSHKEEKRLSLSEFVREPPKSAKNASDIFLKDPPIKSSRQRTRRRNQQSELIERKKESNDNFFSLIEDQKKPFIPPPDESSSQFDTMTNEEIELHSMSQGSPTVAQKSQMYQPPKKGRQSKYDFEVYFAARFAASSRGITINDYYDDLMPISQSDPKERSNLASIISSKIASLLSNKSRSMNEWEQVRDSLLKRNIDELIYLSKRYVDISDLQLTKFFAAEETDPNLVPFQFVDSLTLSGIKDPRISDRTHIFTCHLIQTDINEVFMRIKEMSKAVGKMGDIFGECVFNYVMNWILMFPGDVTKEFFKSYYAALRDAISVAPQSKYMLYLALSLASALSQKLIQGDRFNELPRTRPLSHSQWGVPPLGVPPQAIADHFTFVEVEQISMLSLDDIMKQKLMPIVSGFNATCDFICRHILTDDLRGRARNISYWIDTMTCAAKSGNLFLVFEISACLNNPAIHRLRRTWETVSSELKDRFYAIDELTSAANNYSAMREFLYNKPKSENLPFVLAFARMAEQARATQNTKGIDLMKMEVIGSLAQQVREWGIKTYAVDQNIVEFVRSVKASQRSKPGDLPIEVLSRKLEPSLALPF